MRKNRANREYTTENILTLMEIYLEEWKHRDSMLWKQIFTYFFAILIVMIIPFSNINGFNLDNKLPQYVFPIVGIVLDIIYVIVCYNYAVRLAAVGKTYMNLIDMLPSEYQRKRINKQPFIFNMSYFLAAVFPMSLLILGIILLHISI